MLLIGLKHWFKLQYVEALLVFICVIIDLYLGVLTTLSRLLFLAAACCNYYFALLYCDCNSTIMLFHHLACIETSKSWAYLTMSLLHTKVLGKSWLVVAEGVLYSNHMTILADLNLHT